MEPRPLAPPPRHLPQEVEGGEKERLQRMLTSLPPDLQPNEEENRQLIVIFLFTYITLQTDFLFTVMHLCAKPEFHICRRIGRGCNAAG